MTNEGKPMKCDDLGERLVDSWDDRLTETGRQELDEHLVSCRSCREESEQLEAMWTSLGDLEPIRVPSDRMRSRFYAFLGEEQRSRQQPSLARRLADTAESFWPSRPQTQMAAAAATLVFGLVLGFAFSGARTGGELRALRAELSHVSERVGLSLLSHQSASERLRGVSLSGSAAGDARVVEALLDLVRHDPNVNVRLAAIEALAGRLEEPGVKPRLLNTLPGQESPMLQMTLLDVLLPVDSDEVLEAAEPLLRLDDLDEAVRQRLLEAKGDPA